jgi:hypothetical protein
MAEILKQVKVSRFTPKNLNTLSSRDITRKFGKPEDFVDLFIYDLNNKLLYSFPNFPEYTLPDLTYDGSLVSELNFDFERILNSLGYRSGSYIIKINIQRRKIFDTTRKLFRIKSISSTRTELSLLTTESNLSLEKNSKSLINQVQESPFFRDFILNFGENKNILGINLDLDKSKRKYELLVKTFEPLPLDIKVGDTLIITEELIEPVEVTYDLGLPTPTDRTIPLRGPNFKIDTRLNDTIPTSLKSYNDILSTDTTSSYQKLINTLKGYEIPEIDYSYIRPSGEESPIETGERIPFHFDNFVHFGSATERLKNFEYKLKLIELYDDKLKETRNVYGNVSQSSAVLAITSSFQNKKEKLIEDFDGYEKFLYFESGTYSWPKTNTTEPYIQFHTTSSEALTWLGSTLYNSPYEGGQLESASLFDIQNVNSLINSIPNHIGDKRENEPYLLFCNMIGNFFDPIWAHIKEITQIRNNSHTYGISKDLVYHALNSLGIDAYDQFENNDLINYLFGSPWVDSSHKTTVISGSNQIISRQDITKEIWKRLYHNAPYLLKSKGTARGLQALISCYGIPDTLLNVKEYGGSRPADSENDGQLYTHNKYYKALNGNSNDEGVNGFFVQSGWDNANVKVLSASAKTIEFRIQPHRSSSKYHLLTLTGSNSGSDLHMQLHPYTGSFDFFEQGDRTKFGKIELIQYTESIASSSGFLPNGGLSYELISKGNFTGQYNSSLGEYVNIDENFTLDVAPNTTTNILNKFKTNVNAQILDGVGWLGDTPNFISTTKAELSLGQSATIQTLIPGNVYELEINVLSVTGSGTYPPQMVSVHMTGTNPSGTNSYNISGSNTVGIHKFVFAARTGLSAFHLGVRPTNNTDPNVTMPGTSTGVGGANIFDSFTKLGYVKIRQINKSIYPWNYTAGGDTSFLGTGFHGFQIEDNAILVSGSNSSIGTGASVSASIYQDIQITEGSKYRIKYDRKWIQGGETAGISLNGTSSSIHIDPVTIGSFITLGSSAETSREWTTITDYFTSGRTGTLRVKFNRIDDFYGYLNNFSVKEVTTESEYFPIYNGRFWNINIGTQGISGSNTTCSFGAYQSNHVREVSFYTSSVILTEKANAEVFGNPYYDGGNFIGGSSYVFHCGIQNFGAGFLTSSNYNTTLTESFDLNYSGSLNQIKYYFGETLSHNTLKIHALDPLVYAGNTVSSSVYLVLLLPLAFELEETIENNETFIPSSSAAWNTNPTASGINGSSADQDILDLNTPITGGAILTSSLNIEDQPGYPNHTPIFTVAGIPLLNSHHPNGNTSYINSFTYMNSDYNIGYEETHHQIAPSTVGRSMINDKIRIDVGFEESDDILSEQILSESPTVKRQPKGFNDVGVFFSPQNEINEDIVYTLGRFSMDDTLGDPRHASSNFYPDLGELSNHYFKKLHKGTGRLNTFDFIRLIQYTDYTLFELIKKFTPEKANLKTGLLIEPHYLERSKFKRHNPITQHTFSSKSLLYEALIKDIDSPLTASFVKNNNISDLGPKSRLSGSAIISYTTTKYPDKELVNTFTSMAGTINLHNPDNPLIGNTDIQYQSPNPGIAYQTGFVSNAINLTTGLQYKVSFNYKVNAGTLRYKISNLSNFSYGSQIDSAGGYSAFNNLNSPTKTSFNQIFTHSGINSINYVTFFGNHSGSLDVQIDDFSLTEVGTPDKVRGNQIDYNTTIDINDYYKGTSNWEQGPIIPYSSSIGGIASSSLYFNGAFDSTYKQRNSSGSNELRPHALTPYGNYMNSTISKKRKKSLFENKLGPELLNTSFATSIGTGATLNSPNQVTFTADAGVDYFSPVATELVSGRKYKVTATISGYSDTSGTDSIGFSSQGGIPGTVGVSRFNGNGDISFTFTSDGDGVRIFAGDGVAGVISNMSIREINPQRDIEFDDSLLDLAGWKRSRYDGSRLTGAKIGKYTAGDITYGLNPVVDQKSTTLYFGKSLIGAEGVEDDNLVTIKNHSYVDIEKIILIDKYTDKTTIIDLKNENYKGSSGYIANDFKNGSSFNIHLIDDKITHKLKDSYKAKFNQGYLYKILEHKGINGGGIAYTGPGIQVGYVDVSASLDFPYATSTSQSVLCYGDDTATINSSTIVLKENTLTDIIWPQDQTFGRVDFRAFTSSTTNHYYSSWANLGMFINSMLIPIASESQYRLFGTVNLGQPLNVADYTISSNAGIKSISTFEFDLKAYIVTSSLHDQISSSANMSGFGKALVRPDHLVIPIMQGPHDVIKDKKTGANITWPADGGDTGQSQAGAGNIQLKYYFGNNTNIGSAIYQISYLEETNTIIANIDKPNELENDVGDKGYILIPDNLDRDIKDNLDFFLEKAGYKEGKPPKRTPNKRE